MRTDNVIPIMSNDFDDLPIRARLHAQGLLLAEVMADRLAAQADPARFAAEHLRALLEATEQEGALPCLCDNELARLREHVKFALFELFSAAVNRLG